MKSKIWILNDCRESKVVAAFNRDVGLKRAVELYLKSIGMWDKIYIDDPENNEVWTGKEYLQHEGNELRQVWEIYSVELM